MNDGLKLSFAFRLGCCKTSVAYFLGLGWGPGGGQLALISYVSNCSLWISETLLYCKYELRDCFYLKKSFGSMVNNIIISILFFSGTIGNSLSY